MSLKLKDHITIPQLPEEEQPRNKMIKYGSKNLSNSELLAIIIGTGTKKETAVTLSHRILKYCNNDLSFFLNSSVDELVNNDDLKGIGFVKATKIKAAIEISRRLNKEIKRSNNITCPQDIANEIMEDMKYLKQEHFKLILLDTKNKIQAIETITVGTLNASLVHPREVFRRAIYRSCSSIIIVHNHPSGDPTPSIEDKKITRRIEESGEIIGIKLLDHIIIGRDNYFSFKEMKLLM